MKELLAGEETDDFLVCRYAEPTPRIEIGMKLRRLASSMIDVSDGLLADLCHLCEASEVGAIVDLADLPISENLARHLEIVRPDAKRLMLVMIMNFVLQLRGEWDRQSQLLPKMSGSLG